MNLLSTINRIDKARITTQLLMIFMVVDPRSEEENLLNILHSHMNSYS